MYPPRQYGYRQRIKSKLRRPVHIPGTKKSFPVWIPIVIALVLVAIIVVLAVVFGVPDTVKKIVYTDFYEEVPDTEIIETRMLNPSITQFESAFKQQGSGPGQGIPPEFWESQIPRTADDCKVTAEVSGQSWVEEWDCSKDPYSIDEYGGIRNRHISMCSNKFGGDGVCEVGELMGQGIPGEIRTFSEGVSSNEDCAKSCYDDPNCAFTVYTRPAYLKQQGVDTVGTCTQYSKEAYPFRVKMGPPNDKGIYTLNIKDSAALDLELMDQAIKDAQQREIDEYNRKQGALVNYRENVGDYLTNGCFTANMGYTNNPYYYPMTNWMPSVEDKYKCAEMCSNSSECGSFIYNENYGCIFGRGEQFNIPIDAHPAKTGLINSDGTIRCTSNYYTKIQ